MTKSQTKRALLMSVVSMLLCCTMLIGTTFAWFTDSVESGINTIVAGNLDVELYNDVEINENAKITKDTKDLFVPEKGLWEPGVVMYENFTVANEGNLALKYVFGLNVEEDTLLAQALKVGVVDDGIAAEEGETLTREAVLAMVATDSWKAMESFELPGQLLAEETATFGIVIWWEPTDADNDFNMNNGNTDVLKIQLGVNLFATQLEAENDSFGDDYDKDAIYADTFVGDAADLTNESAKELKGTVALTGLTVDSTAFVGSTYSIGSRDTLAQSQVETLIVDNTKITSGVVAGDVNSEFATISVNVPADSTVVISNSTINGKFSVSVPSVEYPYVAANIADLVFENCTINGAWMGYPNSFKSVTFKNCTFTNEGMDLEAMYTANCFPVWLICDSETIVSFDGCTFEGNRGIHIDGRRALATVNVTNCEFNLQASTASNEDVTKVNCFKFLNTVNATITNNKINTATALYDISGDKVTVTESGNVVADGILVTRPKNVTTAEEFFAAVNAGQTVSLMNDIALDVPYINLTLGTADTKNIYIEGNNHTITFKNGREEVWINTVNPDAVVSISNATLTKETKTIGNYLTFLSFYCNTNLTNVAFNDESINLWGDQCTYNLVNVKLNDTRTSAPHYLMFIKSGNTVNMDGCEFNNAGTGNRAVKVSDVNANDEAVTKLTVKNTTFASNKKAAILVGTKYGADIVLENVDITKVAADSTNAVWVEDVYAAYTDTINVTGGTKSIEQ